MTLPKMMIRSKDRLAIKWTIRRLFRIDFQLKGDCQLEKWYKIINYKDIDNDTYQISNKGRCRKRKDSGWYILKQHANARGGYLTVSLYSK